MVAHVALGFAGTLDVGFDRDGLLLVDWKSSTQLDMDVLIAQLGGYALAYEATTGDLPDTLWGVHLRPRIGVDGFRIRPVSVEKATTKFMFCLHRYRELLNAEG
jgi:hypothetical protein